MPDLERFTSDLITLVHEYEIDEWVGLPYGEVATKLVEFLGIVKVCHEEERDVELSLERGPYTLDHRETKRTRVRPAPRFVRGTNQPVVEAAVPLTAPDHDWESPFDLASSPCRICGISAGQHGEPLSPSPPKLRATTDRWRDWPRERRAVSDPPMMPEPLRPEDIEAVPGGEDWCACGWSDGPHLRSEHEPLSHVTGPVPCAKFVSKVGEFAAGPDSICDRCAGSGRAHGITTIGPPTQIAETLTPLED